MNKKVYKRYIINENIIPYDFVVNTKSDFPKVSVHTEFLRKECIDELTNVFIQSLELLNTIVSKNKLIKLFKYNKINEMVQKWCWHQYNNKTCQDAVIPYVTNNKYVFSNFFEDINYILSSDIEESHPIFVQLIDNVISFLEQYWLHFKSLQATIENYDICISKKKNIISFKHNNSTILSIHKILYNRLLEKLKHTSPNISNVNEFIFCLVFRYSYIDSGNQQLAVHKKIKDIFKFCGVDFELFGSGLNTWSTKYCSLFYDIEQYFGSKGNFFDIDINKGIYFCNPPYDNVIMENAAKKLISILDNKKDVCFIVTIPIWDNKTSEVQPKKILRNYNKDYDYSLFKDYPVYSILKKYIKDELIIPKISIPYFNHKLHTFIYAVNTYMLLVYNNIEPKYTQQLHTNFDKIIELSNTNAFTVKNI